MGAAVGFNGARKRSVNYAHTPSVHGLLLALGVCSRRHLGRFCRPIGHCPPYGKATELRYEKLLAIVGVMAIISLSGEITFLLSMLVIGFPLLFAITAFVYLLAMYPAVRLRRSGSRRWIVVLALLSGLVIVGFGVPLLARARLQIAERSVQGDDFEKPFELVEDHIALVLDERDVSRSQPATVRAPCDEACQGLLRLRRISKVYVTTPAASVAYTLPDKSCALQERMKHGLEINHPISRCYASEDVASVPRTAVVITETKLREIVPRRNEWFFLPWWLESVSRTEVAVNSVLIASKTFIDGEVASAPLYFDYAFDGGATDMARVHRVALPAIGERTLDLVTRLME